MFINVVKEKAMGKMNIKSKNGVLKRKTRSKVTFNSNRKRKAKQSEPKNAEPYASEEDSESILDMIDEDNLEYLKELLSKEPSKRFDNLHQSALEFDYEAQRAKLTPKSSGLLPIKTKSGLLYQTEEQEEEIVEDKQIVPEKEDIDENEGAADSISKHITSAHLLLNQKELLENKKIQIGSLSASILENPVEKLGNLKILSNLLSGQDETVCLTVRKLALVSLLEVFKDILPSYQIRTVSRDVKVRKETLKLERHELILLQQYKKFLQTLKQCSVALLNRRSGVPARSQMDRELGELSLSAMCDLLCSHPYFNYAEDIAEIVVSFLNHSVASVREKIRQVCVNVFTDDKKGEITLKLVRLINGTVKKYHCNVHRDIIEVLLHLKIRDTDLDKSQENRMKRKKLMSRKGNILRLSKSERKRKMHLEQLDKELLEVKAEENEQLKERYHTEIVKLAFGVFFKILKNSDDSKNLVVCLQGIKTYAHCINFEFYIDLIKILDGLITDDQIGHLEKLLCIQTVFVVLTKQGEALNVDPAKFYSATYASLLESNAFRDENFVPLMDTLICSLINGRRKVSPKRAIAFAKRIATMSLQLSHAEALSCLAIMKLLVRSHRGVDILLDLESSSGEGSYIPESNDPEYCKASDSSVFELVLLARHYHPTVVKFSKHMARGAPSTSEDISKLLRSAPAQLRAEFDSSQMHFNPSVPMPKRFHGGKSAPKHLRLDDSFKKEILGRVNVKI